MSDPLTLEELDDMAAVFKSWPHMQRLIAAARRGIELEKWLEPLAWDNSPPPQREDDGMKVSNRGSHAGPLPSAAASSVAPAPSSTVERELRMQGVPVFAEPSPDAGLVERLRRSVTKWHEPTDELAIEAANSLEAKDAEIAALEQVNETLLADEKLAQAYIDNRQAQTEIERLRKALESVLPIIDTPTIRDALKGGEGK
jgi:hypothetical protein